MKQNLVITEQQLELIIDRLLLEKVGVPENILNSSIMVYEVIKRYFDNKPPKQNTYTISKTMDIHIGEMTFPKIEITINIDDENYNVDKVHPTSFGMGSSFGFNRKINYIVNVNSDTIVLKIELISHKDWTIDDISQYLIDERVDIISTISHELKHKYDKSKKKIALAGDLAKYSSVSSGGVRTGVKALDDLLFYMYFIDKVENSVRNTELASFLSLNNVSKKDFINILKQNQNYSILKKIQNLSYENFMNELRNDEENLNNVLRHINYDEDVIQTTHIDAKIKIVVKVLFDVLYKLQIKNFKYFTDYNDIFDDILDTDLHKVKQKFIKHISKYKNGIDKFLVNEFDNLNYTATKVIKRLSKLYSTLED